MPPTEWRYPPTVIRRPWMQALATILLATILAWSSRYWPPGPWNALFLLVPLLIGFFPNKGVGQLLAMLWVVLFIVALVANEVAAHQLFGTCLYD